MGAVAVSAAPSGADFFIWSNDVYSPGQTRASSSYWNFIASAVGVPSNRVAYAGAGIGIYPDGC
jgi:hypothetical protein